MFYSAELLALKAHGGLGVVWIAATLGPRSSTRRLTRRDCTGVDIAETCRYVAAPPQPLSLRLVASLMVGITRVYGQQCALCYRDVLGLYTALASQAMSAEGPRSTELSSEADRAGDAARAPREAITLGTGSGRTGPETLDEPEKDAFFIEGLESLLAHRLSAVSNARSTMMQTPEAGRAGTSGEGLVARMTSISSLASSAAGLPTTLPFAGLTSAMDDAPYADMYVSLNDEDTFLAPGKLSSAAESVLRSGATGSLPPTPGSAPTILPLAAVRRTAKRPRRMKLRFDDPTVLDREQLLLNDGEALVPVWDDDSARMWHGAAESAEEAPSSAGSVSSSPRVHSSRRSSNPFLDMNSPRIPGSPRVPGSPSMAMDSIPFDDYDPASDPSSSSAHVQAVIVDNAPCALDDVISAVRCGRATAFAALLEAVTRGAVNATQPHPYGPIAIVAI